MRTRHESKKLKMPPRSPALKLLTLALALAAALMTDQAAAQTINVNFAGANTANEPAASLSGPAGGLGTTWNQVVGFGGSSGTLLDSTGASTTVSISNNYGLTADDAATTLPILQGSVANFGKGSDATVTISGLASGGLYDVWLVSLRNQPFGGDGTEQYYGNWLTSNATSSSSSQVLDAVDPTINTSTFVAGYNYVLFEDVVATAGGVITFTADAAEPGEVSAVGNRLGLNGLQIQVAAPVIAGPVADATSTVTATPSAVIANGVSASTVKVTLKDASGVRVSNKQVTLANNGGLTPPTALTTNTQGEASFAVSSNTVGTVVFTATVVADSLTLTDTVSVEFTDPGAPVAFNVNFHAGSPATGLVGVVGGPGETWNQGTTSASNLIDATGTVASSVNVTGLPNDGYTVNAALNVFDATRTFFGKGQDTTLSITGLLPNTPYDLYIYALSHNVASWGQISDTERAKGDFVTSNSVLGNGQSQWLDNAVPGTNGDAFIPNGNYVAFQSIVTNGSGNISIVVDAYDGINGIAGDGDGDCRLHVSGMQIRPASGMSVDYAAWRNTYYPTLGLPGADDDGDGLSNDYERIFGLNPKNPASTSPYPAPFNPETGILSYSRRAMSKSNLNYKVWYSTNLQQWFEDNASDQAVTSTAGDVEMMGVHVDPNLLGEPKLFLQVRATPVTGVDLSPSLVNLWGSGNTITLLFSEPMNPSSAGNPYNYSVVRDGVGAINITGATISSDGGSVTLTLASTLGIDTGYTVSMTGVTSGTGQPLGSAVSRQFRTWDNNPAGIKVFILAGQSNMVGYGSVETGNGSVAGAIGSLRYMAVNDSTYTDYNYASLLTTPSQPATSPFRTRSDAKVWWRDGGANLGGTVRKGDLGPPFKGADNGLIGPEFAFGHVLGDFYAGANEDVLIIKCAWGGRDLVKDFRPPSAVAKRGGVVGAFYNAVIEQTREVLNNLGTQFPAWSGRGYEIVGFAWHQGYNDRISTVASAEYKNNLPDLISDLRTVFNKPNLPFVVASTGMEIGAPQAPPYPSYSAVEKAQLWVAGVARPANVLSTDARPFWREAAVSPANQGYHWNWSAESYFLIGKSLGDTMVDLLTP